MKCKQCETNFEEYLQNWYREKTYDGNVFDIFECPACGAQQSVMNGGYSEKEAQKFRKELLERTS
jgi:Zn finger protein HypA/HybF involved in hydrogenase expression